MALFAGGYELVSEVAGHDGSVRSLCTLADGRVISGGHDALAKVWKLRGVGERNMEMDRTLYDHEHWVSGMTAVGSDGAFATCSHDKKVRVYTAVGDLVAVGVGHSGPVTSLSWDGRNSVLISGSWDGTARLWSVDPSSLNGDRQDLNCIGELKGHENGCCVLALPSGDIVTGSSGEQVNNQVIGFQLRVWRGGSVLKSMNSHISAIRSLCLSAPDGSTFSSCGNDGTVRVWNSESFDEVLCMRNPNGPEGSPAFNFSLASLGDFSELVTASDDCCARVWDVSSGTIKQEILHPETVWSVAQLANGDLLTGSSDGFIRLFSKDQTRMAPQAVRNDYVEQAAKMREAIASKSSNGGKKVDPATLCHIHDAPPGKSDGDIKMFNKDGMAWVFQWSGDAMTWVEVGEVMGDAGGQEELDGKLFDRVVPVEVEDPGRGGLRKLKLGFNNGDNPFVVAQEFAERNGLSESHVSQIAEFVTNVRGQSSMPTIDMSGGGRNNAQAIESEHRPVLSSRTVSGPFPLPTLTGLSFDAVDLAKVWAKVLEFNKEAVVVDSGLTLTDKNIEVLERTVGVLENRSRYHASSIDSEAVRALLDKALQWETSVVFPALDLLRVMLTHPEGAAKVVAHSGGAPFAQALALAAADDTKMPTALTGAKVAANFFRHREAAIAATNILTGEAGADKVSAKLVDLADFPNKNVRAAAATAALNCANALWHSASEADEMVCAGMLAATLKMAATSASEPKEEDTVRRCLLTAGCLASLGGLSQPEKMAIEGVLAQVGPGLRDLSDAVNAALASPKKQRFK